MDDLCFPLLKSCDVLWDAWSAIGSLAAAIVALLIAYHANSNAERERAKSNKVIARHMFHELKRIYYISCWWHDLDKQFKVGAIPPDFEPALKLALYDLNSISTPIYDGFKSAIPTLTSEVSGFILAAYSGVDRARTLLSRFKEQNSFSATRETFDELFPVAAALQTDLHVALLQLCRLQGLDPKIALNAGPARYTDPAWWRS